MEVNHLLSVNRRALFGPTDPEENALIIVVVFCFVYLVCFVCFVVNMFLYVFIG